MITRFKSYLVPVLAAMLAIAALVFIPRLALAQSAPPTRPYIVVFYGASSPTSVFTMEVKAANLSGVQDELNRLLITADKVIAVMPKK